MHNDKNDSPYVIGLLWRLMDLKDAKGTDEGSGAE